MLILPMERTFDIRRPPVVTFLLLIVNVIVFLATSDSDEETLLAAVDAYESREILETELPLIQAYLNSESAEAERLNNLASVAELNDQERIYLVNRARTHRQYSRKRERHTDWVTVEQLAAHDPTQDNLQVPDIGDHYRSVIFFHNSEQQAAA